MSSNGVVIAGSPTASGGHEAPGVDRIVKDTVAFGKNTLQAWFDWGLFLVVIVLLIATEFGIEGRRMFITQRVLEDIQMPHRANLVPSWVVPGLGMGGSLIILIVHKFLARPPPGVFHNGVLSAWLAMAATGLMTNILKLSVGRPRPDFFFRCFPSGVPEFSERDNGLLDVVCAPDAIDIEDGYRSFPSGHSSWTVATLSFVGFYLWRFLVPGERRPTHHIFLAAIVIPFLVAVWIAATRVADGQHHATDVIGGAILGLFFAVVVFLWRFPQELTVRSARGLHEAVNMPVAKSQDRPAKTQDGPAVRV